MLPKDAVEECLRQATAEEIQEFKKWSNMNRTIASKAIFSASNALMWVNREKYAQFLLEMSGQTPTKEYSNTFLTVSNTTVTTMDTTTGRAPKKRRASVLSTQSDVISISSDDEKPLNTRLKKRVKAEPDDDVINMCSSDSENQNLGSPKVKTDADDTYGFRTSEEPHSSGLKDLVDNAQRRDGKFVLTRKEKVDELVYLERVPERFEVPKKDVAYVIDLKVDARRRAAAKGGKLRNLDALIKLEDQDSWRRGTNGSTSRETKIALLDNLPIRRSAHKCAGALQCEFFDQSMLDGYQRESLDMSLTKKMFEKDLARNVMDESSVLAKTAAFFQMIHSRKCKKKGCTGGPVMRPLKKAPSSEGKFNLIGCSGWSATDRFDHLYLSIPSGVDEDILRQLLGGATLDIPDLKTYEQACTTFIHPRHGRQKECTHIHFRDGKVAIGKIIPYECRAQKVVYSSLDKTRPIAIVIFKGCHSHPPWPLEKPNHDARTDLAKCVDAYGAMDATGGRINNAGTTKAILGTTIGTRHPSYHNKKLLACHVREKKEDSGSGNNWWTSVVDQYEKEQKCPPSEQYIRLIQMGDRGVKVVVTMNTDLAELLHQARYIVCDFTFKRVRGELNEWEVVVWNEEMRERVTVSRIYCNASTREAFTQIWEGFFTSVEKFTSRPLRFKAFDASGTIAAVLVDMEAAQVQGLGDALRMVNPAVFGKMSSDEVVEHLVRICSIHWERRTDSLVPFVGAETVQYLNKFPALRTSEDFISWHTFCKEHSSKELQDWYAHKIKYPWLLKAYNKELTRISSDDWDLVPTHTNLVESAHVASNRATNIGLSPLQAIIKAQHADAEVAAALAAARESCILRNRSNAVKNSMSRAAGRRESRNRKHRQHTELNDGIENARGELADLTARSKTLKAYIKDLGAQKKGVGRSRHARTVSSEMSSHIPSISGVPPGLDDSSQRSSSVAPGSPAGFPDTLDIDLQPLDNISSKMFGDVEFLNEPLLFDIPDLDTMDTSMLAHESPIFRYDSTSEPLLGLAAPADLDLTLSSFENGTTLQNNDNPLQLLRPWWDLPSFDPSIPLC